MWKAERKIKNTIKNIGKLWISLQPDFWKRPGHEPLRCELVVWGDFPLSSQCESSLQAALPWSVPLFRFSAFLIFIFLCQKWRPVKIAHVNPFYEPSIRAFSYWDYVLNITIENSKEYVFQPEMVCIQLHFHSSEILECFYFIIMGMMSFQENWILLKFLSCLILLLGSHCSDPEEQTEKGKVTKISIIRKALGNTSGKH